MEWLGVKKKKKKESLKVITALLFFLIFWIQQHYPPVCRLYLQGPLGVLCVIKNEPAEQTNN